VGWESWLSVQHRGSWVHSQQIFMLTDFMTPEGIHLISLAVPCGLDLTSHFIPQASPPSKFSVLPPLPLSFELTPEENNLHVLPTLRTCSKLPLSSNRIETPLPHRATSNSSQISVPKLTPVAANLFSMENTSFFISVDGSDWEYRCSNDPTSSSEHRERHSLLKELNLVMSDLTPRKWKLYHRIADKCPISLVKRNSTLCAWH